MADVSVADGHDADLVERLDAAASLLGDLVQREAPLGERTTYRVGGRARLFVEASTVDDLAAVARAATTTQLPVLVIGRGSNMLVADRGFDGIAVALGEPFTEITHDADAGTIRSGGATLLPVLARRSVALGCTGLEWMVGVPGTVGGAVRMNAGGHGADVEDSLRAATIVDVLTGEVTERRPDELGLRFRGSSIGANEVVVDAVFAAPSGDRADGETALSEIVRWRRENQPGGQNAGSVFVNPGDGEVPAGLLIDESGLKGLRHRSAEVSTKHANFIQADPGGSADDVLELMRIVAATVEDRHGRRMRSEVRLIGFPDADVLRRSSDPDSPDHSDLTDHSESPDHEEPSR